MDNETPAIFGGMPDFAQEQLLNYEDTCVKRLLRALDMASRWEELQQDARDRTGDPRLSFHWLADAYPTFPVRLGAERARYVQQTQLQDLFKRFTSTPMFRAFMRFVDGCGIDPSRETAGLFFTWPGATTMVLHTLPREEELVDAHRTHTRIVRVLSTRGRPTMYTIESFDSFVEAIRKIW